MSKVVDLTGKKFNMLTVDSRAESRRGQAYWNCTCDCGNKTVVRGSNLRNNLVKSCGCLKLTHDTHHLSKSRIYRVWRAMLNRCYNENHFAYMRYGGRGITVCEEWRNDFISFYEWAKTNGYNDTLTIDRIDNSKGYNPNNCRFVDRKEQSNNREFCKMITYNGKTQNLMQWSKELGFDYKLVHSRINVLGWSFEKAISTPVQSHKRKEKHE